MEFIKRVFDNKMNKYFYYVVIKVKRNNKWHHKYVRAATIEEIKTFKSGKSQEENLTIMVCAKPDCENIFKVTKQEKNLFNTIEPRDKKKYQFQYCSAKCQEEHGIELRGK